MKGGCLAPILCAGVLAACGDVSIKPEARLPKPLIVPLPADVGLVDQYSFVTARETGGRYYAVTIRYRINLYTPQGEKVDSYTLTGYGNSLAMGMSGGKPLTQATVGAMRDAAAKFLVQFPEQPAGQQLARNEALAADKPPTSAEADLIEAVPIDETDDGSG